MHNHKTDRKLGYPSNVLKCIVYKNDTEWQHKGSARSADYNKGAWEAHNVVQSSLLCPWEAVSVANYPHIDDRPQMFA